MAIDVAPTVAVHAGVVVPHAVLGRETFDPGTAMWGAGAGPGVGFDLGVLLGRLVLPHVSFERAWLPCSTSSDCGSRTTDAAALGLRVTSRGRFRVFGDVGVGLRWMSIEQTSLTLLEHAVLSKSGVLEKRGSAPDAPEEFRWRGVDALRLAIGGAWSPRAGIVLETKLTSTIGSFTHLRTGARLDWDPEGGFEGEVRPGTGKPYILLGLSVGIRGELPLE